MAVSAAAALLDELMGRNRNDGPNAQKKPVHWEDPEVILTVTRQYTFVCVNDIFYYSDESCMCVSIAHYHCSGYCIIIIIILYVFTCLHTKTVLFFFMLSNLTVILRVIT